MRRSVQELLVEHERVKEAKEKIESEILRLKQEAKKYAEDNMKLEERYEMLRHSLNQTDDEVKRLAVRSNRSSSK